MKKKKLLSLSFKHSSFGYIFVLPFIIGFVFFFLSPLVLYITMAFNYISMSSDGMMFEYAGFDNFSEILLNRTDFLLSVFDSLGGIVFTLPGIVIYSFFIAIMLNHSFRGRGIFRTIFFMPVIVASGVAAITQTDALLAKAISAVMGQIDSNDTLNLSGYIIQMVRQMDNPFISGIISALTGNIYNITLSSGVQILIFLAGLQTISKEIYEASRIDGATGWENFWKITLPILSPLILVNSVYTIIDLLSGQGNTVINNIYDTTMQNYRFAEGSAMGTIYFSIVFVALGILVFAISKFVYYEER